MEYPEIYAVDFDKTLSMAKYPDVGEPNIKLIEILKEKQAAGDKIILWTCREGELLEQAVEYCREYGLEFDAVNDNIQENIEKFGNNCRKIFANYYVDDKSIEPDCLIMMEGIKGMIDRMFMGIDMAAGSDMTGRVKIPKKASESDD